MLNISGHVLSSIDSTMHINREPHLQRLSDFEHPLNLSEVINCNTHVIFTSIALLDLLKVEHLKQVIENR